MNRHQRIHIHCCTLGPHEVEAWGKTFPNAYFSFNALVKSYNREQRAALSLLPRSRLLLETDSPHLPVGGGVIYATPAYIGEVGELVAGIRGDSLQALLEPTRVNAQALYGP